MIGDQSKYPRLPISKLRKMMAQSLDRSFAVKGYPITTEQEMILRTLRGRDGVSQTELAVYTGQNRNNLSRTVAILENKGLVRKTNSNQDRRYCEISITQRGEQIHQNLLTILEEWRDQLFKNISVQELDQFAGIAEKLMDNISNLKN